MKLFLPLLLLILFMQMGCSDNILSDKKALKILNSEYPRYKTSIVQIRDNSLSPGIPTELKLLSEKGLASYNYIPPGRSGYGCYGKLTEWGEKYLVSRMDYDYVVMALAKVEIEQVTGIREVPAINSSVVEYTEKIVSVTPVGEIFEGIKIGRTYNVTATLVKYNDGWRIEELSTNAQKVVISEDNKHINPNEKKEGKFSGVYRGHETVYTITLNPDGTYNILYEDIEMNSEKSIGYYEEGKLRFVTKDYQGNDDVHYFVFSSSNCIRDGNYEYCKE